RGTGIARAAGGERRAGRRESDARRAIRALGPTAGALRPPGLAGSQHRHETQRIAGEFLPCRRGLHQWPRASVGPRFRHLWRRSPGALRRVRPGGQRRLCAAVARCRHERNGMRCLGALVAGARPVALVACLAVVAAVRLWRSERQSVLAIQRRSEASGDPPGPHDPSRSLPTALLEIQSDRTPAVLPSEPIVARRGAEDDGRGSALYGPYDHGDRPGGDDQIDAEAVPERPRSDTLVSGNHAYPLCPLPAGTQLQCHAAARAVKSGSYSSVNPNETSAI